MKFKGILLTMLLVLGGIPLLGQNKSGKDSLFRLVQAERAEQVTEFGINYRRVKGHARFMHNDTYLLCDSASWNVDAKFIEAFGNVQIIQDKTMLKSERMDYWIDDSKAVFQGGMVELFDKDGNTLRTERLIYITKDSTATFEYGGALKSKDGNVIESRKGTYDSKEGLFTFTDRVEMFMDTTEIKTSEMRYFTETDKAHFGRNTLLWRDNGFLRADAGWYDRGTQMLYFADNVFMFDPSYDAWGDEVYYDQRNGAADLYRNAQILDTTNKSIFLGDHIRYIPATDSLSDKGLLTGNPAILYFGENENHEIDTLYVRADTFFVYAVPRCDLSSAEVSAAEKRIEDLMFDFLAKKRESDAEAREKERIEKLRSVGKLPPEWVEKQKQAEADSLAALAAADSLAAAAAAADSLAALAGSLDDGEEDAPEPPAPEPPALDTSSVIPPLDASSVIPGLTGDLNPTDTTATAPPRDTTPVRHVLAYHNVRMYRSDIQAACDSMIFTEIDSVARLYGSPVLWNEIHNQLSAEEMNLLMKGGTVTRGNMVTDAWVISQQDSIHFDQIKSTEMLGYFRDNKLYRFDALGGVSAIFYMSDDEVITTINVKESKSLTAALKDARAQRMLYVESIKSDVYPVGDLPPEKQRLKDFNWRGDERPVDRYDITSRDVKESERKNYVNVRRPLFAETNKFFDNYIFDLFEKIEEGKRLELERRQAEQDSLARLEALKQLEEELKAEEAGQAAEEAASGVDSLASIAVPFDKVDSTATVVSAAAGAANAAADSLSHLVVPFEKIGGKETARTVSSEETVASQETVTRSAELSRAEKRALKKAERQARREARRAARAARKAEREARRLARKNKV